MIRNRRLGFRSAADRGAPTGPAHRRDRGRRSCDARPSANHPDSSYATTFASDTESQANRGGPHRCSTVPVIQKAKRTAEDIRIPLIAVEQTGEVIQVIPQARVLERTVEQIKDVPVIAE